MAAQPQDYQLLTAVNGFYQAAFQQLVQYTFAIIALVGVLVPLIAGLVQWRSNKSDKENLEKSIHDEITLAKAELMSKIQEDVKTLIAEELQKLKDELDDKFTALNKKLLITKGATFHVQASASFEAKNYSQAVKDCYWATTSYLSGDDELNGRRTLTMLIDTCLPKITKSEYESKNLEEAINALIKFLRDKNQNSRFSDSITSIETLVKSIKSKEVAKT